MISPVIARFGTLNTTAARFTPLNSSFDLGPTGTETIAQTAMVNSGVIQNLYVRLNTAPGSGKSWTVMLRKNAADTAATFTISDLATIGSYTASTISYVAGDYFTLQFTPSGTPTGTAGTSFFETDQTGQLVTTGGITSAGTTTQNWYGLQGSDPQTASANNINVIMPTAGTFSNLYLLNNSNPGNSKSYTATLFKNGSSTGLTATNTGAASRLASDTTNSVSVVAGDTVYWEITPTGIPTALRCHMSVQFTPTTDGESIQTMASSSNVNNSGNQYQGPATTGALAYVNAETNRLVYMATVYDFKKFYGRIGIDPSPGSWGFAVMLGGAASALTFTIAAGSTTGNNTGTTVTNSAGDTLTGRIVGTSLPSVSTAAWSFVTYRAPAVGGTSTPTRMMMGLGT